MSDISIGTQTKLFLPNTACKAMYWKPPVVGQQVKDANLHFYEDAKTIKKLNKEVIISVTPHPTNCPECINYDIRTNDSVILVTHIVAPRYDPRDRR